MIVYSKLELNCVQLLGTRFMEDANLQPNDNELPFHLTALVESWQRSLLTGSKQATGKLLLKLNRNKIISQSPNMIMNCTIGRCDDLERFSTECRQTKVIILTNHKGH